MTRLFIRLFLGLTTIASVILISAYSLTRINPVTAEVLMRIGLLVFLAAFMLLIALSIYAVIIKIVHHSRDFFSVYNRNQRQWLFQLNRQDALTRLVQLKKNQINYFHQLKMQRLLTRHNKKQINELAQQLLKEMNTIQPRLSRQERQHWQQQIKQYQKRLDDIGLLSLHQQMTAKYKQL